MLVDDWRAISRIDIRDPQPGERFPFRPARISGQRVSAANAAAIGRKRDWRGQSGEVQLVF
jgi:hypothetical protein